MSLYVVEWEKAMAADAKKPGATIVDANQLVEEIVDTILKNLGREPSSQP